MRTCREGQWALNRYFIDFSPMAFYPMDRADRTQVDAFELNPASLRYMPAPSIFYEVVAWILTGSTQVNLLKTFPFDHREELTSFTPQLVLCLIDLQVQILSDFSLLHWLYSRCWTPLELILFRPILCCPYSGWGAPAEATCTGRGEDNPHLQFHLTLHQMKIT